MEVYSELDLIAAIRNTDFSDDFDWNEPAPERELCFE